MKNIIPLILIFICFPIAFAQEEAQQARVNLAVWKGILYLKESQWQEGEYAGCFGKSSDERKYGIAGTSFACLAFLANGIVPGQGEYGKNLDLGIDYILKSVNPNGYISRLDDESRMHGHGFAVLLLAEVHGMISEKHRLQKIREALNKSVQLILDSQTPDGGWGYLPGDTLHEGSITVCQLQALRAARNVGIWVPKKNIDRALEYLRRSANPDGSFKYRLGMTRAHESFPLTAAGVSSLNATGEYESPEIQRGTEFMMRYLPPKGLQDDYYQAFYFYGHFYAVQAMYHSPPEYWEKWYPAIRSDLLKKQKFNGSWGENLEEYKFGSIYPTAVATLILQVPYNYLSIFQR